MNQEQRIVQPLQPSFASLPEVREPSSTSAPETYNSSRSPKFVGTSYASLEMLTHQSRSLPSGPPIPGSRLNRTPSISSQGQIESAVRKVSPHFHACRY